MAASISRGHRRKGEGEKEQVFFTKSTRGVIGRESECDGAQHHPRDPGVLRSNDEVAHRGGKEKEDECVELHDEQSNIAMGTRCQPVKKLPNQTATNESALIID